MQKLYAYVDESGQETAGAIFVVSVAIMGAERDTLQKLCEELETVTKKGNVKWHRAKRQARLDFMRQIIANEQFIGVLHYALFKETRDYDSATVKGIAQAIRSKQPEGKYTVSIFVDALRKPKRLKYGSELRKLGIHTLKIRGITSDENSPLIRLADGAAGLIRDALSGKDQEAHALYTQAKKKGVLTEV